MSRRTIRQDRFVETWKRNLRMEPDPADKDADLRRLNNYFVFWLGCEAAVCKRTCRCAGDARACFKRLWPLVPERMKVEFRVTLRALNDGGAPAAIKRRVRAELARFDEMEEMKEAGAISSFPRPARRGEGAERMRGG